MVISDATRPPRHMESYIWCWCWSWYLCWARVGDQTRIYKPDPDQTRTRPGFCWSGRAFPKPQKWKPDETKPNKCTPTTAQNTSKTHRGLENRRGDPKKRFVCMWNAAASVAYHSCRPPRFWPCPPRGAVMILCSYVGNFVFQFFMSLPILVVGCFKSA